MAVYREDQGQTRDIPTIGVTMGDPAGIGPEIILKSLAAALTRDYFRPVVVGDLEAMERTAAQIGIDLQIIPFDGSRRESRNVIEVIDLGNVHPELAAGVESADAGRASAEYIVKAVELWRDKVIDAIATAPINKRSLNLGGYDFPGHTEFLAELTSTADFAMSFFAGKLRVVLLSTHVSLLDAIARVKRPALVRLIEFTNVHLSALLARPVKIAVAGLNPHASEGGMFGNEEANEIAPAIEECRQNGIDVSGPYSPDTIFLRGHDGEFDAVIACYHDQATIAVKSLAFGSAVNVTLGLPLIRTSVDHGTAFDKAGKGIADASSMTAAIELAAELVSIRKRR